MNFIIFNSDEMRAESVGCYGHPLAQTPNLDRLAAEGTRFDNAFCQHTVCTPSRCSFVTGWYPHVRGHRSLHHALRLDEPNLYRYLKDAGWHTWWDGGHNDMLSPESFRLSICESHASDRGGRFTGPNPYDISDPRYHSFLFEPFTGPIEEHGDWRMVHNAIDFLRTKPDRPFCIHLPLIFPHPPYGAPQPWHDLIDPDDLPPLRPADLPGRPDYHAMIRRYRRLDEIGDEHFRKINAVYLGMVSFMDKLLGDMLDALDRTGLADDTAILFFADHGDYAGDYGLVEKWTSGLEDVLTRVPLIIRAPGGKRGHVVAEPVELFDIMATVLDLAGVEPSHTHFARSLVPQLGGAAGDPARAAFAEGGFDAHDWIGFENYPHRAGEPSPFNPEHIYTPKVVQQMEHPESIRRCAMIRTATHKLVRRPGGVSELYDVAADPRELDNLHERPEYAAVRDDLTRRLCDWCIHTADVLPPDRDSRTIPPTNSDKG